MKSDLMESKSPTKLKFDLEPRTEKYSLAIIKLARQLPTTPILKPIISQIVRSGTSIGANYAEANEAGSKKDFQYKISICKKEAKETTYWLKILSATTEEQTILSQLPALIQESRELTLIFHTIVTSCHRKTDHSDIEN